MQRTIVHSYIYFLLNFHWTSTGLRMIADILEFSSLCNVLVTVHVVHAGLPQRYSLVTYELELPVRSCVRNLTDTEK